MEVFDLENVYISDSSFQRLLRTCTDLLSLNLKGNFALITPNNLQVIAKKLPKLKSLGLGDGRYLTGTWKYDI
jgi:hypothetical protein